MLWLTRFVSLRYDNDYPKVWSHTYGSRHSQIPKNTSKCLKKPHTIVLRIKYNTMEKVQYCALPHTLSVPTHPYTGWAKNVSPYWYIIKSLHSKKSTVILHVHQLRNYSIFYQVVCNFALVLVLNILWFSVVDTRMHRSSQSIHTVIDVTLYVIHRIFYR